MAVYDAASPETSLQWPENMPTLRKHAKPLGPSDVMVVQGCPGEGKTLFIKWMERRLAAEFRGTNRVVLDVSLEEVIEKAKASTMTHITSFPAVAEKTIPRVELMRRIGLSADDPIFYMGPSLGGAAILPNHADFFGVTPQKIGENVEELRALGLDVGLIGLDYLQLLSPSRSRGGEEVATVLAASREYVQLARNVLRCASVVGAQSDLKKLKDRADKIPGKADVQWSSAIAQDGDVVIGLWKPYADHPLYSQIRVGKYVIPVFADMSIARVNKWRNAFDVDGRMFVIAYGNPIGELFEPDLEMMSQIDIDKVQRDGIQSLSQVRPEHMRL